MRLELRYAAGLGDAMARLQLGEPTLMVGSLTSNQIVLAAPGVEPIHCLIEPEELHGGVSPTAWRVVDLGTLAGVKINGARIDVEATLKAGDTLQIGGATLTLTEIAAAAGDAALPAAEFPLAAGFGGEGAPALPEAPARQGRSRISSRILFSPRQRAPARSGRMLEVVAYWGDTVLNVDLFHPDIKGFDSVTIGDPSKAHFLSGGKEFFKSRVLADVEAGGCVLRLTPEMRARVRKSGELKTVDGAGGALALGPRDYAHVEYGPIHYFLHYANPPQVELPKLGRADRVLGGLSLVAFVAYIVLVAIALTTKPAPIVAEATPPWDPRPYPHQDHKLQEITVHVHETRVIPPPPVHPATPVAPQHPEHQHPVQHQQHVVETLQHPPPVQPVTPPPQPAPPQPHAQKTAQQNQPPVQHPSNVEQHHAQAPTPTPVQAPSAVVAPHPQPTTNHGTGNHASAAGSHAAAAGTGAKGGAPAGDHQPSPQPGNTGGPGLHNALSGALKGHQSFNNMGVEGGTTKTPSMADLSKLKLGAGHVFTSPGGIHTDLSPGGGMGIKSGTLSHDAGLGTVGQGHSMDLPGSSGQIGKWGTGPGGLLGGGGPGFGGNGKHGPGGPGLGFGGGPGGGPGNLSMGSSPGGHKGANVVVAPPIDPLSGETYSPEWIMAVIRQHLNEIRHCYEQTLQRAPNTAGKIKVGFTIGVEGRVTTVSVLQSDINDMMMRGCVTGKIQRWAFPRPPTGNPVSVTYPFIFSPVN